MDIEKTRSVARNALEFCKMRNFNTDRCILIDMGIHSGIKRLLVWNLQGDPLERSYLVGHGCCNGPWSGDHSREAPVFSI